MAQETMTVREAAQYLKLKTSTIYKLTAARMIPFCRPTGKKIMFRKKDLDEWLDTKTVPSLDATKSEQL